MKLLRVSFVVWLVMFWVVVIPLQARAITVVEIMEKMDELYNMKQDLTARMKFTQKKVDEGVKVVENIFYKRDREDKFLSVGISPESNRGNGYLRVDDNMWMYRRNTRTFQIMKREDSISGTDAKAGDMEKKKFTDLYRPKLDDQGKEILTEETLGKAEIPVYRFIVVAKVKDVTYPTEEYWVRRDNFLTLKRQSYALSGTLMQSAYFPKYTVIEDRYFPIQMIFVDEFEKGNKTMLEMSGISLKPIEDYVFTKPYLENLSK
ncbi:MAG: outer membrane lipoprotein-sorting protein [bacterium]